MNPPSGAVTCFICGDTIPAEDATNIDISPEDEYYPKIRAVCPTHGGSE